MSVFALLSLSGSIIVLFLGNFIFYQNKKRPENILYSIFCLGLSYWSFVVFMYCQAEKLDTAYFWVKMSSFWIFTFALLLHFVLVYTNIITLYNKKDGLLFDRCSGIIILYR